MHKHFSYENAHTVVCNTSSKSKFKAKCEKNSLKIYVTRGYIKHSSWTESFSSVEKHAVCAFVNFPSPFNGSFMFKALQGFWLLVYNWSYRTLMETVLLNKSGNISTDASSIATVTTGSSAIAERSHCSLFKL